MDLNVFRFAVLAVSVFCYFLILVSIPLRIKSILKRAGKCVLRIKGKNFVIQILIIISCGGILALLGFRELGAVGDSIVCLVAILGVAIGSEEAGLFRHCGIYENGIISGGRYLPLSEIYSIPSLNLSEEEQKSNESSALKLITEKKGTVTFVYESPEERREVLEKILELRPELKP